MLRVSKKAIISFVLMLTMLCGLTVTTAFAANGDEKTGSSKISMSTLAEDTADATDGDIITISPAEFSAFITYVNGNRNTKGVTFELTGDVETAVTTVIASATIESDSSTFSPVVTEGTGFQGTFDGGNHKIAVNLNTEVADTALFGYLAPSGTIENLTVTGSVESSVGADGNAVGGVVGYNSGAIINVKNTATVKASATYNVGGVVGFNNGYYGDGAIGAISNSHNTGTVTGYDKIGGIAGENAGIIESCYNTGAVNGTHASRSGVGGITGRNGNNNTAVETGIIRNCYNQGAISSGTASDSASQGQWVGGIAGFQNSLSSCTNCYSTGTLVAYSRAGNITGSNENLNGVVNCYGLQGTYSGKDGLSDASLAKTAAELKAIAPTLNAGAETNVWVATSSYPTLNPVPTTLGEVQKVVKISDPTKLTYEVGDTVNTNGLLINAVYDGYVIPVTNYTVTPTSALTTATKTLLIRYNYGGFAGELSYDLTVTDANSVIYLDGTATTDGTGTEASPCNNITSAVNAAGAGGTIRVVGTVTITGSSYYDNVTYVRYGDFDGPMFKIDAPNNDYGVAFVTFTTATIDGNNGDVFEVDQGRLRLRNGLTIKNAQTGVEMASTTVNSQTVYGELDVNWCTFEQTKGNSIEVNNAGNLVILEDFGTASEPKVSIDGPIYLTTGAKLTVQANILSPIKVTSEKTAANTVIATCSTSAIASASVGKVTVNGSAARIGIINVNIVI